MSSMILLARLKDTLGLRRNIVVMLAATLLLGMGEELWVRFVPRYLEVLGTSAWGIGAYGVLKDFLDAVYQYFGGWLWTIDMQLPFYVAFGVGVVTALPPPAVRYIAPEAAPLWREVK